MQKIWTPTWVHGECRWVREGLMRFVKTWSHQHWPGNSPLQYQYFLIKNDLNLKMNNEYQDIRSESWNMKNKIQKKFTQLHHSCSLKNTWTRIFFHGFDFHFGTCASSIQRVLVFGSGWVKRTWIGTLEFNISKVFTQGNTKKRHKRTLEFNISNF